MAWITMPRIESGKLRTVIDEIEAGSHRATALVAGAFVEEHLTMLIRARLAPDEKMQGELFRPGGALGDFGVKVDLGFLLRLYTKQAWKELDTIVRIRNDFAHKIEITSFDIQPTKDLCANLSRWETIIIKLSKGSDKGSLVLTMGEKLEIGEKEIPIIAIHPKEDMNKPYQRYVASCRFYIAAFTLLINMTPESISSRPIF
jgi:hypothetical protein